MTDKITSPSVRCSTQGEEPSIPTWIESEIWNTTAALTYCIPRGQELHSHHWRPSEEDQTLLEDHCFTRTTSITSTRLQPPLTRAATTTLTNRVSGPSLTVTLSQCFCIIALLYILVKSHYSYFSYLCLKAP